MGERGGEDRQRVERTGPAHRGCAAGVVDARCRQLRRRSHAADRRGAPASAPARHPGRGRTCLGGGAPAADPLAGVGRGHRPSRPRSSPGSARGVPARTGRRAGAGGGRAGTAERSCTSGVHDARAGRVRRVPAGSRLLLRSDGPHDHARQRPTGGRGSQRRGASRSGADGVGAGDAGASDGRTSTIGRAHPVSPDRPADGVRRAASRPGAARGRTARRGATRARRSNGGSRGRRERSPSATGPGDSWHTSAPRRVATTSWWSWHGRPTSSRKHAGTHSPPRIAWPGRRASTTSGCRTTSR